MLSPARLAVRKEEANGLSPGLQRCQPSVSAFSRARGVRHRSPTSAGKHPASVNADARVRTWAISAWSRSAGARPTLTGPVPRTQASKSALLIACRPSPRPTRSSWLYGESSGESKGSREIPSAQLISSSWETEISAFLPLSMFYSTASLTRPPIRAASAAVLSKRTRFR